jgi:tetratricopeptide (TPR) repeat protein
MRLEGSVCGTDPTQGKGSEDRMISFLKTATSWIPDRYLSISIIAILAFLIFAGSLNHDLVWDDHHIINYTRQVADEKGPAGLLSVPFMEFYEGSPESTMYYRPVVLFSMWANDPQDQPSPFLYHLVNVLLHVANSLMVFVLLMRVLPGSVGAFIGGMIFAVHPVHAESVSWVSGRTDMLAAFFILLSVNLWYRARLDPTQSGSARLLLSLLFFSLACLAKEVAFLLPFVVTAWALSDRSDSDKSLKTFVSRDGKWILGWLAVTGSLLLVRVAFLGIGAEQGLSAALPLTGPAFFALSVEMVGNLAVYLRFLFFPWPLAVYYPPSAPGVTPLTVVVALSFVALCLCLSGKRHGRIGLLALFWIVVFLLPVTGVIGLGLSVVAERFCYLPSVGVAMAMGYALGLVWSKVEHRRVLVIGVSGLIALLSIGSVMHSGRWADEVILFNHAVNDNRIKVPNIYFNLGTAYMEAGDHRQAAEAFEEAIRLHPSYVKAMLNLTATLIVLEEHERALEVISEAEVLSPGDPQIWSTKGVVLELRGLTTKALEAYSMTMELDPEDPTAAYNKGNLLLKLGRMEESAAAFKSVLSAAPFHFGATMGLGRSLEGMGKLDMASEIYLVAIEVNSEEVLPYTALGRVLLRQQKPREAGVAYQMAFKLAPSDQEANRGIVVAAINAGDTGIARAHIDRLNETESDLSRDLADLYREMTVSGVAREFKDPGDAGSSETGSR